MPYGVGVAATIVIIGVVTVTAAGWTVTTRAAVLAP
jgi:hypothetical protein